MATTDDIATVDEVAEAVWQHTLQREPFFRIRLGLAVEQLPSGSEDEAVVDAQFAQSALERLARVSIDDLDDERASTALYLRHLLRDQAVAPEVWWTTFAVAPYTSYRVGTYRGQLFEPLKAAGEHARSAALILDLARLIRTATEKTRAQQQRGWALPAPAIDGIVATWQGHRAAYAATLPVGDGRVDKLVDGELLPAFDELLAYLEGPARDTAVPGVGLAQYPGGDEAYARLVRQHASYDVTADEVHSLGLEHVADLTDRMRALREAVGFDGTEPAYHDALRSDPRFHAGSPDDVAATYRRHIARIEPLIGRAFSVLPAAPYDVERLDPALEPGMTFGYYEPPTTANPVGRYRYNGSALDARSQLNAAAIIYHELVPGHHFHLARQAENESLPMIRRELSALTITAFTEGWAEYAADVAGELGCYDDPWDAYGHLLHQRFLAQRLVVDTGMNALGWSLEKAREYMSTTTMESPAQVESETLRYSTDLPGQALGYRLGFTRLHQLRDKARDTLGAAFDAGSFHEQILGPGALPLEVVEHNIDRWVDCSLESDGR